MLFCTYFIYVPITGCISPGTDRNQVGPLPMHSSSAGGATRPRGGHLQCRGTTFSCRTSVCLSVCAFRGRQAPGVLAPFLQFIYPKLLRPCLSPLPLGQVNLRLPPRILTRHRQVHLARRQRRLQARLQQEGSNVAVSQLLSVRVFDSSACLLSFLNISIYVSKNIIMLHSLFNILINDLLKGLYLFCLNPVIIIYVYQSQ